MKKTLYLLGLSTFLFVSCENVSKIKPAESSHDLVFPELAKTWDEGMPLGNAFIGSLVWEKENALRMSLDRVDLWDLRPSDSISGPGYSFDWVYNQVMKKDYLPVQKKFDHPYDRLPAPSKIPGAGLEFSLEKTGKPESVHLYLNNALCEVTWPGGMQMKTFVHANQPVGWFIIENVDDSFIPELIPPVYNDSEKAATPDNAHSGSDLDRLGYVQGDVVKEGNLITYHQKGWGDFFYDAAVKWEKKGNSMIGVWSLTSSISGEQAVKNVEDALKRGLNQDYNSHMAYWNGFWKQSSINIPDQILAKQYANEMYKFGSATRENSYPISLQAVWTADNGKLPPWKGDYHHDLNTQLSYWPAYTGNYLTEGLGYLNTLWDQRETNRQYTRDYYGKNGLNVPGVCTLEGVPMAGWIQYSFSPTVAAWLSQHFYLHYKYSMDKDFLKNRAYPYLKEVVTFLEEITYLDKNGVRQLPLSTSPEIFNNSINAWFHTMTNYDLALIQFAFNAASELASELSLKEESEHWKNLSNQLPQYDLDETKGLTFAKGFPYNQSHRHFSNAMAIHPMGLIDWSQGQEAQEIIKATINNFEKVGPDYWCGYSYSWFGNMKARAMDGEGAAKELRTFAECFCLKNTFHANGDQTKSGKSKYTYRPFTLEGNFAFASGVQDMLIQSHTGIVRIFPAIPKAWQDVSFDNLRTYGAFLVSAEKVSGAVSKVTVKSEKGGLLRMANPFANPDFKITGTQVKPSINDGIIELETQGGQTIILEM